MHEIILSVVVLTYNHEKYIKQAIESVLAQQTSFDYEILIGDDCSQDNTQGILLEYLERNPEKIKLVLRDKNIGATKNCYDIICRCKGKYVAFLEGDDYWIDSQKLQKQVDFLENNKSYIAVSHVIEARDLDNSCLGRYPDKKNKNPFTMKKFLYNNKISATALMFRNIIANNTEKYRNLYTANRNVGDFTIFTILLDLGDIFVLDDCMAVYRCRSNSSEFNYNSLYSRLDKYRNHFQVLSANNLFFGNKYDFSILYTYSLASLIRYCLKTRSYSESWKIYKNIPLKYQVKFWFLLPYVVLASFVRFIARKINH